MNKEELLKGFVETHAIVDKAQARKNTPSI